MLIYATKLIGTIVLSVQAGGPIAQIIDLIVDPNSLKIIAFKLSGPSVSAINNILDISSIREHSDYGMVVDDIDELIGVDDVVRISNVAKLNFGLFNLKVKTKKGSRIGKVIDYTVDADSLMVQQIVVKRPTLKSFLDPELVISRKEIVEVNDYEIIVRDEEKVLKARAEKEDFIPNFVNPFRSHEQDFAPADNQTPADKDKR